MKTSGNDPQRELIMSAAYGAVEQMAAALDRGARLDEPLPLIDDDSKEESSFQGHHALSAAVLYTKPRSVAWLLARGARSDAPFPMCGRALLKTLDASFDAAPAGPGSLMHLAAQGWLSPTPAELSRVTLELMQLLGAAGVDPALRDVNGATPLHLAADRNQRAEVVTFLLDAGCPLDAVDRAGWTALDYAKDLSCAETLLARGADPNGKAPPYGPGERYEGWLQLTRLLYQRAHGIASARLRYGARATPHALFLAAAHAQPELVEALLRAGADPSDRSPNQEWDSALAAAVRTGEVRSVEALLRAGAPVDEYSLQRSEAEVGGRRVFELLAPRVDRPARSRSLARLAGDAPVGQLEVLVQCGVDLDATVERPSRRGKGQYTALHSAAEQGNERNVAYLLRQGAQDGPGPDGASARELARRSDAVGARACVELLSAGTLQVSAIASPAAVAPSLQVGRRASHAKFGSGIVSHIESGSAAGRKVRIQFEDGVERTLLARFVQPA